jgi:hypothetical protein
MMKRNIPGAAGAPVPGLALGASRVAALLRAVEAGLSPGVCRQYSRVGNLIII